MESGYKKTELSWDDLDQGGYSATDRTKYKRRLQAWHLLLAFSLAFTCLILSYNFATRSQAALDASVAAGTFSRHMLDWEDQYKEVVEESERGVSAGNDFLLKTILQGKDGFQHIEETVRKSDPKIAAEIGNIWSEIRRDALIPKIDSEKLRQAKLKSERGSRDLGDAADAFARNEWLLRATGFGLLFFCFIGSILAVGKREVKVVVQNVLTDAMTNIKDVEIKQSHVVASDDIFERMPVPFARFGQDSKIDLWNAEIEAIFGVSADEVIGRDLFDVMGWHVLGDAAKTALYRVFIGQGTTPLSWVYNHASGEKLDLQANMVPVFDQMGVVSGAYVMVRDISQESRQRAMLIESDLTKAAMLKAIPDTLLRFDIEGNMVEIHDNANLFGKMAYQIVGGQQWRTIVPPNAAQHIVTAMKKCLVEREPSEAEIHEVHNNKEWHLKIYFTPCGSSDILAVLHDATSEYAASLQVKESNERIQEVMAESSTTDGLTGLLNHHAMRPYLEAACQYASQPVGRVAFAYFDLDSFGDFVRQHGDEAGDNALKLFASRMKSLVRKDDIIARSGPEEFLVIMPEIAGKEALELARKISECGLINTPHPFSASTTVMAVSGVAMTSRDVLETLKHALDEGKQAGPGIVKLIAQIRRAA
ncbi:MAG: diguanylate cyclase [Armatimonadetes bacterium]|nr:diguanylate cyclase [Armatimonadota bacterium]